MCVISTLIMNFITDNDFIFFDDSDFVFRSTTIAEGKRRIFILDTLRRIFKR